MSLKYLVNSIYIPDDNSTEIIEKFAQNSGADILVFPDVHMKKGSMIANGVLVSSDYNIYLACLGVENCGYTFGKIENTNEEILINSFKRFSTILRKREDLPQYTRAQILEVFDEYLKEDYVKKQFLYDFLKVKDVNDLLDIAHTILDTRILNVASKSLCTLGGGNHFFELHRVTEVYDCNLVKKGDFIYMLHSDSISVGDTIYELYSDLHEMKSNGSLREMYRVAKFRLYQYRYFKRLCRAIPGLVTDLHYILNPENDYQAIDIRTELGRNLMLAHNLSSIFGEMNRDAIVKAWYKSQNINQIKIGTHSHDNVAVELYDGRVKVVHRNGVQNIGNDEYCILPSAMGNFSYIMRNTFNEKAFFSANHGTGRMQDKHIAKENFSEEMTTTEMRQRRVALFRVGAGNLAEQNMHAFKDPVAIVNEMEKNNLAKRAAKTCPIAVIKG